MREISIKTVEIKSTIFAVTAMEDYRYWRATDVGMAKCILAVIRSICEDPYLGSGSSEFADDYDEGFWSQALSTEHALIYTVRTDAITIVRCRNSNVT